MIKSWGVCTLHDQDKVGDEKVRLVWQDFKTSLSLSPFLYPSFPLFLCPSFPLSISFISPPLSLFLNPSFSLSHSLQNCCTYDSLVTERVNGQGELDDGFNGAKYKFLYFQLHCKEQILKTKESFLQTKKKHLNLTLSYGYQLCLNLYYVL